MRKKIITFLIAVLSLVTCAYAQQDCGAVDCQGRCGRFVDSNGDGFCDHGRLSATKTVEPETKTVEKNETDASLEKVKPQAAKKTENPVAKEAVQEKVSSESEPQETSELAKTVPEAQTEAVEQPTAPVKQKSPYSLILISSLTLGLYLLTSILVKTNVMKQITHRRIWNMVLLITGLVSCLLGFFLVIQINYDLKMDWLWTVKLYHVQFGISMTIITVIHILWHIPYYKSIFAKKKS